MTHEKLEQANKLLKQMEIVSQKVEILSSAISNTENEYMVSIFTKAYPAHTFERILSENRVVSTADDRPEWVVNSFFHLLLDSYKKVLGELQQQFNEL